MRNPRIRLLLGVIVGVGSVFIATVPAPAHHSVSAEFDRNQPITFTGIVVRVDWMNPHIYTLVEVDNEDGTRRTYRVEGMAPNMLYRRGWRSDSIRPGDRISVEGLRAKNPESSNIGSATITLPDGRVAFSGTNP